MTTVPTRWLPPARPGALEVVTPEGIRFSFPLAGPVVRALAWIVDMFIISILSSAVSLALLFGALISLEVSMALIVLGTFLVQFGYGIVMEWLWRGQTIGKRMLGLRVMDIHGLKLQFSQVVVRNLLRMADMLPAFYLVGGACCFFTRHAQRLGDLAANTIVIRRDEAFEPSLHKISGGKFNSLRSHPHLAARLRQRASPAAARVALQALIRRDQIEDVSRVELFSELAAHFHSLVEFPEEAMEGISDEQYIRNVVDILMRPK